jgi:outer membrane receptor protein involved in Fe transport
MYGQMFYVGPMYLDETTTRGKNYGQGGNVIYNASTSYALNDNLDLSASMTNIFGKTYSENAYAVTQPWSRTLSMPRTFFVSATVKY